MWWVWFSQGSLVSERAVGLAVVLSGHYIKLYTFMGYIFLNQLFVLYIYVEPKKIKWGFFF